MTPCISCGASNWLDLPSLPQAMLSDGRAVQIPLARSACAECGLARHTAALTGESLERIFNQDYGLYAHAPGAGFERERQHVYANWLLDLLGDTPVTSLFEAGCGNGSLLQELRRQRPAWRLSGVEPAPDPVSATSAPVAISRRRAGRNPCFAGSPLPPPRSIRRRSALAHSRPAARPG